jgi:pyruvate/2-oxoglutarate dehydrogenase complex dihydrolipoamide acyltransferase (E2) component
MRLEVALPNLGKDAPDKATVSFWYRAIGEGVKKGDDLVEMFTDKATFNVPSPAAGKLLEIRVKPQDVVKVGQAMAVLETES